MSSCEGQSYIGESLQLYTLQSEVNIESDEALSYSALSHSEAKEKSKRLSWSSVPDNMHPTPLQLTVDHHPFIDVAFVWPRMREKILYLCHRGDLNEKHLCKDSLSGHLPGAKLEKTAFILYGDDPMDEEAWEEGQEWAMKYWYLLDDQIVRRTNWWRRQRGLSALSLPSAELSLPIFGSNSL